MAAGDGLLVETDGWQGLVGVRSPDGSGSAPIVAVRAGTRIFQLGLPLYRHGLALINQGDIDKQSLAGAIGTGTHGTGPTDSPEAVMGDIDRLVGATRHFEFFWQPDRDRCACKSLDELPRDDDRPTGPEVEPGEVEQLAKLERRGWSHQIISSIRDDKHTEMEYAVPAEHGPACFDELRTMIRRDFPDLRWPVEYRHLASDDVLISAARGRPTVTISAHQDVGLDDRPLFEACETIFRRHEGRPHWGKVHYQTGAELAGLHIHWRRWWRIRDRYDPDGRFVTPYLESLRP